MIYITVKQSPRFHQMSLEEFLFGGDNEIKYQYDGTSTRTYEVKEANEKVKKEVNVEFLIKKLQAFNEQTTELRNRPRNELYNEFYIPKKSGGLRKISAPEPALMNALRQLKTILEEDFHMMYHTSAFAYIKGRNVVDCMKRHQSNESKWYGKFDLSNFFGSTTLDFVMKMFSMVFPCSEIVKIPEGHDALETALGLAFLNGGLPQGTPVSPTITNIMMIPIDYRLSQKLREHNHQHFVYTRYADDFQISSKYTFRFKEIEEVIAGVLQEFEAPFQINAKKTRYGSSAGSNWNLGLMLNKDNEITVGHKKKRQFQAMLSSYILDYKHGKRWSKEDVQVMDGLRNYYRMVEGERIDGVIEHINQKFQVDVRELIQNDLRGAI